MSRTTRSTWRRPFLRRQVALDAVGVEQQADLVAVADGGKRQDAGEFGGQVALAQGGGAEIAGGADVHQQKDGELALFGEFLDEGPAGARRDIPVDGAHFVAGAVFAHFVEVHAAALEHRMIFAGQAVIDHAAGADLQLPHAAHDGFGGLGGIGRHALSRNGQGVENLMDHVLGGDVLGLGFVGHGDAMAQHVQAMLLTSCGVT